jgi:hypothetical protein
MILSPLRVLLAPSLLAVLAAGGPVIAADAPAATQPADAEGFVPIFNGKSLDGWKAPDMSFWRVEDGAITGEVTADHKPKENVFLVWQGGEYSDFEMKFSFRVFGKEANSGMQFRSEVKERGLVHGYQADIDGLGKFAAGIWDEYGTRRSLAGRGERVKWDADGKRTVVEKIADPFGDKAPDLTQWTEYHIIARGDTVQLKVNGKLACEFIDQDKQRRREKGIFAVPVITKEMKVQYKDIRLKKL